MLEIDRQNGTLKKLQNVALSEAKIGERADLQELLYKSSEAFFKEECNEDLFLLDVEVEPSNKVRDRIDILAIDANANTVVVELKRGHDKFQLLQALSYTAMISDPAEWERIDRSISPEKRQRLNSFLREHFPDKERDAIVLNSGQRIILIAESYDYEVLRTAEWLTEHGVRISCYQVALAKDSTGKLEYLTAAQVFPAKELAEHARQRGAIRVEKENAVKTLDSRLEEGVAQPVAALFESLKSDKPRMNIRQTAIAWPKLGKMRFKISPRGSYARVVQLGRYEGDEDRWQKLSAPVLKIRDNTLRFRIVTNEDVSEFLDFLSNQSNKLNWTKNSDFDEEEAGEE